MTQKRIHELLDYNESTGVFIRKKCTAMVHKVGEVVGYNSPNKRYLYARLDKKRYSMHRIAWLYVHGEFPDGNIDHINHDTFDNSIGNLRVVTFAENMKNKSIYSNNTSGCMGVNWHKKEKKWNVRIQADGKRTIIGRFEDKKDAIKCRKMFESEYGLHRNHGKKKDEK